jgi:hypothetical protein
MMTLDNSEDGDTNPIWVNSEGGYPSIESFSQIAAAFEAEGRKLPDNISIDTLNIYKELPLARHSLLTELNITYGQYVIAVNCNDMWASEDSVGRMANILIDMQEVVEDHLS